MKIVCLGDSVINGYGVLKSKCWVSQLRTLLNAEVINKGINGDTTSGILARFYHDVVPEKPDLVLIDGGWNDFVTGADVGVVQSNTMALVHQAFQNGIIPVIVAVQLPNRDAFEKQWPKFIDVDESIRKYREYHDWLLPFCEGFCIKLIDGFELMDNDDFRTNCLLDGIHMNQLGHDKMADFVAHSLITQGLVK